jgi:hypothetical protein
MTLSIMIADYQHSRIEMPDLYDQPLEARTKLKEAIVAAEIRKAKYVLAKQSKPLWFVIEAQSRMNEIKIINGKCKV